MVLAIAMLLLYWLIGKRILYNKMYSWKGQQPTCVLWQLALPWSKHRQVGCCPYTPGTLTHTDFHEIYLLWPTSMQWIPVCELDNSFHS